MYYIKDQDKLRLLPTIQLFLIYGIVITIVLSLLNLNSICIILLVFTWLVEGNLKGKWKRLKTDKLFIAYSLYLLVQIISLAKGNSFYQGWKEIESKLGFVALPLVLCSTSFISTSIRRKVMTMLSITVTIAAAYCLMFSIFNFFFKSDGADVFFYHKLVSPLAHHAVYFSVYVFLCLVFIIFEAKFISWFNKNRFFTLCWIGFLVLFLFLLSSKLVLSILGLFLIIFFLQINKNKRNASLVLTAAVGVLLLCVILFTDNPVKSRFVDMKGNLKMLSLDKYDAGMYFNPWEFRLLLWRVTYEIIKEQDAWLTGVGPTNDQKMLQRKYVEMGLYSGEESRGDHGYLEFNCHNQFLQSGLQSGIPGIVTVLFFCCMLFLKAVRKKEKSLYWILVVIFCFFFTESVFERQYGMILTTLFPLIYLYSTSSSED